MLTGFHRIWLSAFILIAFAGGMIPADYAEEIPVTLKTELFDRDPGWEGRNNRIVSKKVVAVTQDFGFSGDTHFAGEAKGELGGTVTRAMVPAFYADKIDQKTLQDKFTASGSFALMNTHSSSGFFFGWFNAAQPGGSRPVGSFGLDMDAERSGGRLAIRLITASNKSCGTFITPFVPGKFRPTPIRNDGTRYTWILNYDPGANDGKGRIEFSIKSNSKHPEEFEGKTFTVNLPEGFKMEGTTFDRFGLMNMGKPGGSLTVYFDDLHYDGRTEDFLKDPAWDSSGNRVRYEPEDVTGAHRYGFCPKTSFAGGSPGEMGGVVWRTENNLGWYADRVGLLMGNQKLEAEGRVTLAIGAPDSGVCLGWFNSATNGKSSADKNNFVGIAIGGPTRVGHYFLPVFVTTSGKRSELRQGPILVPGKPHHWKLVYNPAGSDGNGTITVALDDASVTLTLKPGQKNEGVKLDRFGLVSTSPGGGAVKIYFDDIKYSVAAVH